MEENITLGSHPVTIVDSSGGPLGGTSGGSTGPDGNQVATFESANGRYQISLDRKVLTINGDQYLLAHPTDTVRIVDGRVEINGVETAPDTSKEEAEAAKVLRPHPILDIMGMKLAEIKLPEPREISIVWESGEKRQVLMTDSSGRHEEGFQVAVQQDSRTDILRVAIGDSELASAAILPENPFKDRGSTFEPAPTDDGTGRFVIMTSVGDDRVVDKLVIVTKPRKANGAE